jgi:hypothetical protein
MRMSQRTPKKKRRKQQTKFCGGLPFSSVVRGRGLLGASALAESSQGAIVRHWPAGRSARRLSCPRGAETPTPNGRRVPACKAPPRNHDVTR